MPDKRDDRQAIDQWLLELREGSLSTSETFRINQLLTSDAELRDYVVHWMLDESLVCEELQYAETESIYRGNSVTSGIKLIHPPDVEERNAGRFRSKLGRRILQLGWLPLAACLLVAVTLTTLYWQNYKWNRSRLSNNVATLSDDDELDGGLLDVDGVAILTRAVNVDWDLNSSPIRVDDRIAPHRLRIQSGLLQLEFFSGATVVLEGPADLEVISSMRCKCNYGKLRVEVPRQAIGFTIAGHDLDVIDLGTEFAMRIEEGGAGEVHVLDGEVSLHRSQGGNDHRLKNGEAVRFDAARELVALPVDRDSFVDKARLDDIEKASRADRYERWLSHSQHWAKDPSLKLYYNFEHHQYSDRRLRSAIHDASESHDGAIVGCRWSDGRFEGKGALEFKRTSDRVRVFIDGEFESLSLVAWFRVEGLDQWYSSLLLADEFGLGKAHWQLTGNGMLKFSIGGSGSYSSRQILRPNDLGRWLQVATVYDGQAKVVRHFLDGKLDTEHEMDAPMRLSIGAAEIGNWNPEFQKKNAIRSLNGLLDEIAVFSRPLSVQEIHESYLVGTPN